MKDIVEGRIWVLGDNINTDIIVPSRVLTEGDRVKLLAATLEVVIPDFYSKVKPGDIIVAGKNFGSGSSREEAVYVLKELGIAAVIAESFARIYYRNCINNGLPPIEPILNSKAEPHPITTEEVDGNVPKSPIGETGDIIRIDFKKGVIINDNRRERFVFKPYPEFILELLKKGGMIPYLKSLKGKESQP